MSTVSMVNAVSASPVLAPGTRVRLLATALPVELEADTGRIVRPVAGGADEYVVRLDRPARYAGGGRTAHLYLNRLRAGRAHLAVLDART